MAALALVFAQTYSVVELLTTGTDVLFFRAAHALSFSSLALPPYMPADLAFGLRGAQPLEGRVEKSGRKRV
jgi:hypothetical protein